MLKTVVQYPNEYESYFRIVDWSSMCNVRELVTYIYFNAFFTVDFF